MSTVLVLNGPNLNLLGQREPEIYGTATLDDCIAVARAAAETHGWELRAEQYNSEGEMIDAIHAARSSADVIVVNPGAFTHYSYAIADALAAFSGVIIELHLSNVHAREEWRRTSVISPVATGIIAGLGIDGYGLAVHAAISAHERGTRA